ncbi:hypothetical protein F503_08559 [Ophiostoma piceae UAMH 11346]|uniref:Uncharacterized protein n=1 Tax=Ophiostoma piceae (strain UAMH 11346) TaxID=1262450 RepID=S3BTR3_OPHP1|nr:hypothetical protein F503_08559 [Ophiostoma piceae UAMH 11346]
MSDSGSVSVVVRGSWADYAFPAAVPSIPAQETRVGHPETGLRREPRGEGGGRGWEKLGQGQGLRGSRDGLPASTCTNASTKTRDQDQTQDQTSPDEQAGYADATLTLVQQAKTRGGVPAYDKQVCSSPSP